MTVDMDTGGPQRTAAYGVGMTAAPAFDRAVAHTLGIEGGYSDHPSDRGGKTNWGITEAVARTHGYRGAMDALPKAVALDIYRDLYWDRIGLDFVAEIDADIALELFDTGVNMGAAVAARFLQRVLNALNRQGRDYGEVTVDGRIGPKTIDALRALRQRRGRPGMAALLLYLNALQGARYIELAEARPANEDFIFGWVKRLSLHAVTLAKDVA